MKQFIKILLVTCILIICVVLYSRYIAINGLITNEIVINSDNMPDSYNGLKIVHFSDLHYTRVITDKRIIEIKNEINLINPDIVVFTGDLIDSDKDITIDEKEFLIDNLSNINSKYGKYAIIGNHDYANNYEEIIDIYANSDFILLDNDYDIIYNENKDKIFIGGVSSSSQEINDLDKTMTYFKEDNVSDIYKLLLIHEPDFADSIVNKYNDIDLILAGHSHGGQVRLPIFGALYTPKGGEKYIMGHYILNDTSLYVSSGIGVSRYNFRLFNTPSINFYRINKTTDQ